MQVKELKSLSEFNDILTTSPPSQLIIVDFTAKWCGPCRVSAPLFLELSSNYPQCRFFKVDVDDSQEIAKQENVTSMPTFKFYKQGKNIDEVQGADMALVEVKIKTHQGPNDDLASKLGISGHSDLAELVNPRDLESLNLNPDHDIKVIFKKGNKQVVESDTDEQLIISVGFTQAVKLHSLKFIAPLDHAPRNIKLFVNSSNVGFDDAFSLVPTQEFSLTEADYAENAFTELRFVRFQHVTKLTIFVEDNQTDDELTKLQAIALIGSPVFTTNMDNFQKKSAN
ncbi:hypothetical protein DSO57_1022005 [Entomophthora muscae]|uniref:Uncharacterized protein n=2 Tax=Entomophthora muscae TaxID=34485 RepID=A0ACC2SSE6_9FUNG|nr:hypothetical protein DSO57_1022005 [Entomophthora muscae]